MMWQHHLSSFETPSALCCCHPPDRVQEGWPMTRKEYARLVELARRDAQE